MPIPPPKSINLKSIFILLISLSNVDNISLNGLMFVI